MPTRQPTKTWPNGVNISRPEPQVWYKLLQDGVPYHTSYVLYKLILESWCQCQESDRIGTDVPPSDSKLGAVVARRDSLGQRAREKGLGKHPIMYQREEDTGVPLRDATCFELQVRASSKLAHLFCWSMNLISCTVDIPPPWSYLLYDRGRSLNEGYGRSDFRKYNRKSKGKHYVR